jgi:hypothetical protein
MGNFPCAILWTWPYHVRWFCTISFTIVSSSPVYCLVFTFLILSFLDNLDDLLRASISVTLTRACKKRTICEMHSRFRPEDLKGRKHQGKKCLHRRITQKWILKKYRNGYTPDFLSHRHRSNNGRVYTP